MIFVLDLVLLNFITLLLIIVLIKIPPVSSAGLEHNPSKIGVRRSNRLREAIKL